MTNRLIKRLNILMYSGLFQFLKCLALVCAVIAAVAPFTVAQGSTKAGTLPSVESRTRKLQALLEEEWQYELRTNPENATQLGDNRYNDRLSDYSPAFFNSNTEQQRRFLAQFEALDPAGLTREDVLSRELMMGKLRTDIEGAQFKPWEMPVDQMHGPHLELPDLVALTPFNNVSDYENYLARLREIPRVFSQITANMQQGMRDKLMPPRYLLEKVTAEIAELAGRGGEASPFAAPLKSFPAGISPAEQKRLRQAILAAIDTQVVPAYQGLASFFREGYAPHGRSEPGVWALPDGEARYRYDIRYMTTTDMTPQQIHELGLKQVAEIEAQMLELAHKLGFNDIASLNQHIKKDRKFYASSGQQLLELYSGYAKGMEAELPKLFGRLPKNKLTVIPMEESRAKNEVPADYTGGAADGSRPGHINVNEWDPQSRLLLNVEAVAYHEGIPGHHLQISIAQELAGLPAFRRNADYNAFVEGWALYSEQLGKDVGKYQDPYSDYGRLENEMWRAIRLVVDTGVHEMHWPRERMVEYFHRYTAMDEPNLQTEVDRYIAWPGQALAYKLGQLEFLKLREEARQKLGKNFDIRRFHDQVLGNGALPLDVLDAQGRAWIESEATR